MVRIGQDRGVPVVFDAAHALGAIADGRPVGGFGDAEVFSLTPTKVLVAGEGGLVATRDAGLAKRLRMGRDYGNPGDYNTRFAGLNARMSEFHAAMALESLEMLDETLDRRRKLAALYADLLVEVPGVRIQEIGDADVSTYKDFSVVIEPDFGLSRDDLVTALAADGVETRNYFDPPVHQQQSYADFDAVELPATDALAANVVSLPIYPDAARRPHRADRRRDRRCPRAPRRARVPTHRRAAQRVELVDAQALSVLRLRRRFRERIASVGDGAAPRRAGRRTRAGSVIAAARAVPCSRTTRTPPRRTRA